MPYLIDGHNLIPHLGISLSEPDDEEKLIALLQEYCRVTRKGVEVYFDGASLLASQGKAKRRFGGVTAYHIRPPREADDALEARLGQLGKEAKNWTVVSSDRRVQAAAKQAHARVASAEAFAGQVREALRKAAAKTAPEGAHSAQRSGDQPDGMSEDELREWLQIFAKK